MEFYHRVHTDQQSHIECETWLFYWIFCIVLQFSKIMIWNLNVCHSHVRRVASG